MTSLTPSASPADPRPASTETDSIPRIEVLDVTVDEAATLQGELLVQLQYRVRATNQVGNLVFPFYFREGGRP